MIKKYLFEDKTIIGIYDEEENRNGLYVMNDFNELEPVESYPYLANKLDENIFDMEPGDVMEFKSRIEMVDEIPSEEIITGKNDVVTSYFEVLGNNFDTLLRIRFAEDLELTPEEFEETRIKGVGMLNYVIDGVEEYAPYRKGLPKTFEDLTLLRTFLEIPDLDLFFKKLPTVEDMINNFGGDLGVKFFNEREWDVIEEIIDIRGEFDISGDGTGFLTKISCEDCDCGECDCEDCDCKMNGGEEL